MNQAALGRVCCRGEGTAVSHMQVRRSVLGKTGSAHTHLLAIAKQVSRSNISSR